MEEKNHFFSSLGFSNFFYDAVTWEGMFATHRCGFMCVIFSIVWFGLFCHVDRYLIQTLSLYISSLCKDVYMFAMLYVLVFSLLHRAARTSRRAFCSFSFSSTSFDHKLETFLAGVLRVISRWLYCFCRLFWGFFTLSWFFESASGCRSIWRVGRLSTCRSNDRKRRNKRRTPGPSESEHRIQRTCPTNIQQQQQ